MIVILSHIVLSHIDPLRTCGKKWSISEWFKIIQLIWNMARSRPANWDQSPCARRWPCSLQSLSTGPADGHGVLEEIQKPYKVVCFLVNTATLTIEYYRCIYHKAYLIPMRHHLGSTEVRHLVLDGVLGELYHQVECHPRMNSRWWTGGGTWHISKSNEVLLEISKKMVHPHFFWIMNYASLCKKWWCKPGGYEYELSQVFISYTLGWSVQEQGPRPPRPALEGAGFSPGSAGSALVHWWQPLTMD